MPISKDIDASRLSPAEFDALTRTLVVNRNGRVSEADEAAVKNSKAAEEHHRQQIEDVVKQYSEASKAYEARIAALEAKINGAS